MSIPTNDRQPDRPDGHSPPCEGSWQRAARTTLTGTVIGFTGTFGLWAVAGGWGPPCDGLLILAGFVGGLMYGVGTVPDSPPA